MRLLILCPYPPGTAASQRFRFEQYIEALEASGIEVTQEPFWDAETWRVLYREANRARKAAALLRGFSRRLKVALGSVRHDYVFIHLEAAPLGPPVIEALLFALRRRVVYDIDDAIFMSPPSERARWLFRKLKWRTKVSWVAERSHKVICVNQFLADWAAERGCQPILVPTTIDPEYHRPPAVRSANVRTVIGWTGSHSTLPYLELVRRSLVRLADTHEFELVVICDRDPGFDELPHYRFVPWREETEIEDLQQLDVGLMPVADEPWARGKVGFKAIQYSALGIPSVVSDVGSGREVIADGETGLVVNNSLDGWCSGLQKLLDDPKMRAQFGRAARERVLQIYAVPAQVETYKGLFSQRGDP